jgi:hypothetical protein
MAQYGFRRVLSVPVKAADCGAAFVVGCLAPALGASFDVRRFAFRRFVPPAPAPCAKPCAKLERGEVPVVGAT